MINVRYMIFVFVLFVFFLVGCGSKKKIKEGDTFEVMEEVRENATVQSDQSYSDGFTGIIPKGSIIKVESTPLSSVTYFDVILIEVHGKRDQAYIENLLVPEAVRNSEGYKGFYVSIPKNYTGKKIKRVSE